MTVGLIATKLMYCILRSCNDIASSFFLADLSSHDEGTYLIRLTFLPEIVFSEPTLFYLGSYYIFLPSKS